MADAIPPPRFKCIYCISAFFDDKPSVEQHTRNKHEKLRKECKACANRFHDVKSLKVHEAECVHLVTVPPQRKLKKQHNKKK